MVILKFNDDLTGPGWTGAITLEMENIMDEITRNAKIKRAMDEIINHFSGRQDGLYNIILTRLRAEPGKRREIMDEQSLDIITIKVINHNAVILRRRYLIEYLQRAERSIFRNLENNIFRLDDAPPELDNPELELDFPTKFTGTFI